MGLRVIWLPRFSKGVCDLPTRQLRWTMNNCREEGYGKPADIWAMGVTAYFLMAGYLPFDREYKQLEIQTIISGDYKFEPGMF